MVLAMLSWGGSWVTARWAHGYPAEVTAFWRFLISALSFLPILFVRKESLGLPRQAWGWVVASAITLAAYNVLFLVAMQHGPGGYGGVLVPTLNPLFAFVLGVVFWQGTRSRRALFGLALGLFGGLVQILGPSFSWSHFAAPENLFLVSAAFTYGLLTQLSARAQRSMTVFQYSFWTSLLCTGFLAPLALMAQPGPFLWSELGSDFWTNVLYLALAAGTFGTTLYFEAARRVGAAKGASFAFLVPVSALALAWIFLAEVPQWTSILGGALSIAAVLVIQRPGANRKD